MKIVMSAIILALLSTAAIAQSEDWFNQQQSNSQSQQSSNEIMAESIRYVDKTALGKEYHRLEMQVYRDPKKAKADGTYRQYVKTKAAYEETVNNVYDGKMANSGNWRNAYGGDNQSSGAKSAADKTGGNAHMSDKAK